MDEIYLDVEQQDSYLNAFWLKSEEESTIAVESGGPGNVTVNRDLAPTGADRSTIFEIKIVFEDFVPRILQGAANDMDWEREYRDDGTVKATIQLNPIEMPTMTGHQTLQDWPEGEDDHADYVLEEHVRFLISNAERQDGRFFKERVNGTVIGSDGTTGTPDLRTDDMDNEQLVVPAAGPTIM